ncbi:MAG: AtpZ/AtpI family protein [Gemmataceae bacterium]
MFPGPTDPKKLGRYLAISQVGFEMVVPIILGLVLDHYLGWSPWGVIVGAVIGLTGGVVHLVQLVQDKDDAKPKPPEPA